MKEDKARFYSLNQKAFRRGDFVARLSAAMNSYWVEIIYFAICLIIIIIVYYVNMAAKTDTQ